MWFQIKGYRIYGLQYPDVTVESYSLTTDIVTPAVTFDRSVIITFSNFDYETVTYVLIYQLKEPGQ